MYFHIVLEKGSYKMCLEKDKHFTKMSTEAERMNSFPRFMSLSYKSAHREDS